MAQDILYDVREACKQLSLPVPADAFGSQDETALMMASAANLAGTLINGLREWQIQCVKIVFPADGVRFAFDLPADFDRFVDSTGWSTMNQCPVHPVNAQEAARLEANQGSVYNCRLFGGKLEFTAPPTDGDSIKFEYVRKTWVLDADDPTQRKEVCSKNGDIPVFDWLTMTLGIKVKWLELKRMDTAAAMSDLMDRLNQNANADVMGSTLSLVPRRGEDFYISPDYNLPSGGYGGP